MPTTVIQQRLGRLVSRALNDIRDEGSEMTEEELLGIMLANHLQYNGVRILKVAAAALEDANFHGECELVRRMITNIQRGLTA